MASHTPVRPKILGSTSSEITINTHVRIKEIMAEVFPSESAVKKDDEKILNPLNKKVNEKIVKPSAAIR